MNAHNSIADHELVLQHCLAKTQNFDREQALTYGQLSGFYDAENKLTLSGENLAAFLKLDLAHERVG